MATKRIELTDPTSSFSKSGDDELLFIIRASDPIAVDTIRFWVSRAIGKHEPDRIVEACALAIDMEDQYEELASGRTPFFARVK